MDVSIRVMFADVTLFFIPFWLLNILKMSNLGY